MSKFIDLFNICDPKHGYFGDTLSLAEEEYFSFPILEGEPGPRMRFRGKEVIVWSLNNYLGSANDPIMAEASAQHAKTFPLSHPMGARILSGNTTYHKQLENKLAEFLGKQAAHIEGYGYMGVIGIINAIIKKPEVIIIDRESHACMMDAAYLAQARTRTEVKRFIHNNIQDLEKKLIEAQSQFPGRGCLIMVEGAYGMSGRVSPLNEIVALKKKYGARLFVDDAHGFGVLGQNGKGTGEHFGVLEDIDLYFGTFAKAFSGIGGFVAGNKDIIKFIHYNSRTSNGSKALPTCITLTHMTVLDKIVKDNSRRTRLWTQTQKLQQGLKDLGLNIGDTSTPVTPVYIPNEDINLAAKIIMFLREEKGIFTSGVMYPIIPRGQLLLRMIPTCMHSDEDIAITLNAFEDLKKVFNLKDNSN